MVRDTGSQPDADQFIRLITDSSWFRFRATLNFLILHPRIKILHPVKADCLQNRLTEEPKPIRGVIVLPQEA